MTVDLFLELLKEEYLGNTLQAYLIATLVFFAFLIFFKILKVRIFTTLDRWAKKTKTDLDDVIIKNIETIPGSLYFFTALYISLQFIAVYPMLEKVIKILLVIQIIYWATKVVSELIEYVLNKTAGKEGRRAGKNTTYYALSLMAKIVLWSTGLLLVLSNLGVNISALVASMGIGGIAIALAIQNILGDIFSSFSLYLDKPFEVGDYIVVGDKSGTVKKIGLKTTRIEALQGEEIVISNNELTSTHVRNFKKMQKRRISFNIGVVYDTKATTLAKIPKLIKEVVTGIEGATFNRAHFASFGDFSLNFEIVYYVESGDYEKYMDIQQKINLGIFKVFEKESIHMAFPTQTLHVSKIHHGSIME